MGKEHPRAPAPAEMSKKRKALEGGGEPQLPEEEPTAWFGGGHESGSREGEARGKRQGGLELRTSAGMFQPSSTAAALSEQLELHFPHPTDGILHVSPGNWGGLGWS